MASETLPADWKKRYSKSKPGKYFWANEKLQLTFWTTEEVLEFEKRLADRSKPKDEPKTPPLPPTKVPLPSIPQPSFPKPPIPKTHSLSHKQTPDNSVTSSSKHSNPTPPLSVKTEPTQPRLVFRGWVSKSAKPVIYSGLKKTDAQSLLPRTGLLPTPETRFQSVADLTNPGLNSGRMTRSQTTAEKKFEDVCWRGYADNDIPLNESNQGIDRTPSGRPVHTGKRPGYKPRTEPYNKSARKSCPPNINKSDNKNVTVNSQTSQSSGRRGTGYAQTNQSDNKASAVNNLINQTYSRTNKVKTPGTQSSGVTAVKTLPPAKPSPTRPLVPNYRVHPSIKTNHPAANTVNKSTSIPSTVSAQRCRSAAVSPTVKTPQQKINQSQSGQSAISATKKTPYTRRSVNTTKPLSTSQKSSNGKQGPLSPARPRVPNYIVHPSIKSSAAPSIYSSQTKSNSNTENSNSMYIQIPGTGMQLRKSKKLPSAKLLANDNSLNQTVSQQQTSRRSSERNVNHKEKLIEKNSENQQMVGHVKRHRSSNVQSSGSTQQTIISEERLALVLDYAVLHDVEMSELGTDELNMTLSQHSQEKTATQIEGIPKKKIDLLFVVDTCSLGILNQLIRMCNNPLKLRATLQDDWCVYNECGILLPWQVLQEIDYIKDNKKQKYSQEQADSAQSYVRLINLQSISCKFTIQSALQDGKSLENFHIKTADDHILKCCLEQIDKVGRVLLITNDVNLRNKSRACQIESFNNHMMDKTNLIQPVPQSEVNLSVKSEKIQDQSSEIQPNSTPYKPHTTPYKPHTTSYKPHTTTSTPPTKIQQPQSPPRVDAPTIVRFDSIILPLFSRFTEQEMKSAFNDDWMKIVFIKPPWNSVKQIIENINKHWRSVFVYKLNRSHQEKISDILKYYRMNDRTVIKLFCKTLLSTVALIRVIHQLDDHRYNELASTALTDLSTIIVKVEPHFDQSDRLIISNNQSNTEPVTMDQSGVEELKEEAVLTDEISNHIAVSLEKIFNVLHETKPSTELELAEYVDLIERVGVLYNSHMLDTTLTHASELCSILNYISERANLGLQIGAEQLLIYTQQNTEIMRNGLTQLEQFYMTIKTNFSPD